MPEELPLGILAQAETAPERSIAISRFLIRDPCNLIIYAFLMTTSHCHFSASNMNLKFAQYMRLTGAINRTQNNQRGTLSGMRHVLAPFIAKNK